jgi:hypothetical protein
MKAAYMERSGVRELTRWQDMRCFGEHDADPDILPFDISKMFDAFDPAAITADQLEDILIACRPPEQFCET